MDEIFELDIAGAERGPLRHSGSARRIGLIAAASALAGLGIGYLSFADDEPATPTTATFSPQIVGTSCHKGVRTPDGLVNRLIIEWSDGTATEIPHRVRA